MRGPTSSSDCVHPEQYFCNTPAWQGCWCDTAAPLSAAECDASQQFQCMGSIEPGERTGCSCALDAPLGEADCDNGYEWSCDSYEPPVGCECVWTIVTQ